MLSETLQHNPEQIFASAVDNLRKRNSKYRIPPWIENGGRYMERHVFNAATGGQPFPDYISFNPNAYDPARPWEPKGKLWIPELNPQKLIEDPFDLDNLRIIPKEWVDTFYYELEELAHKDEGGSVVGMIGMGGTIAMRRNRGGLLSPQLRARDLLRLAGGGIEDDFEVATLDFPKPIDSSQNEIDYNADLVIVLSNIWNRSSDHLKTLLSGFIVAHGTDTMASSAAHTAVMLGADLPFSVEFVGSQKSSDARPLSDVPANIAGAFRSLDVLSKTNIHVVGVYAGGTSGGVYPAVGIEKISDAKVTAFASLTHPLILSAENFGVDSLSWSFRDQYAMQNRASLIEFEAYVRKHFNPVILRGYTPLIEIRAQQGDDPAEIYRAIMSSNSLAVHLVTFGSFTDNDKVRIAIMNAAGNTGKTVFASNPFPEGRTDHDYETSVKLRESGVIATTIPPTVFRAKMAMAEHLLGYNNLDRVVEFITTTNIVGEVPVSAGENVLFDKHSLIGAQRAVEDVAEALMGKEGIGRSLEYGLPDRFRRSMYEGKIKNPRNPDVWFTIED